MGTRHLYWILTGPSFAVLFASCYIVINMTLHNEAFAVVCIHTVIMVSVNITFVPLYTSVTFCHQKTTPIRCIIT